MQANYAPFIARVIQRYEGGYGWDKGDTGGPTKYGITCYDLAEHRGKTMNSMSSWAPIVQAMTLQEAEDIYAAKYAAGLYFNSLRSGPDCCILDYGINSGVGRPLLVARRLLNFTNTSNPALIAAINAAHVADPKWFVDALCQERLAFMHQIRGGAAWSEFGRGWGTRVADVAAYSDNLAVGALPPDPPPAPTVIHPKVTQGDPNASTNTITKTAATAAGGAAAAHAVGPPAWVLPAIIGSVVVGGIALAIYEQYKTTQANLAVVIPSTVPPMPAAVKTAVSAAQSDAGAPHA